MYNFLVFYLTFFVVFGSASRPVSYNVELEKGSEFLEEKLTAPGVELVRDGELKLTFEDRLDYLAYSTRGKRPQTTTFVFLPDDLNPVSSLSIFHFRYVLDQQKKPSIRGSLHRVIFDTPVICAFGGRGKCHRRSTKDKLSFNVHRIILNDTDKERFSALMINDLIKLSNGERIDEKDSIKSFKITGRGLEVGLGFKCKLKFPNMPTWSEASEAGFHLESSVQLPTLPEDEDFREEECDRRSDGSPNASNDGLGGGFDGVSIPDTCSNVGEFDFAGLFEEEIPYATFGGSSSSSWQQPQEFEQQQVFPQQQQQPWAYPQQVEQDWFYPTGVPVLVPVVPQQNSMTNAYPYPESFQVPFPTQCLPQQVFVEPPQQPPIDLALTRFNVQEELEISSRDDFCDSCCASDFGQSAEPEAEPESIEESGVDPEEHADEGNRDESLMNYLLEENNGIIFRFAKGGQGPVPPEDVRFLQVPHDEGYFVCILKTPGSLIRTDYFYVLKRNGNEVTAWKFDLSQEVGGMHVADRSLLLFKGGRKTFIKTSYIFSLIDGRPYKKSKGGKFNKVPECEMDSDGDYFKLILPEYPDGWKPMWEGGQREQTGDYLLVT